MATLYHNLTRATIIISTGTNISQSLILGKTGHVLQSLSAHQNEFAWQKRQELSICHAKINYRYGRFESALLDCIEVGFSEYYKCKYSMVHGIAQSIRV